MAGMQISFPFSFCHEYIYLFFPCLIGPALREQVMFNVSFPARSSWILTLMPLFSGPLWALQGLFCGTPHSMLSFPCNLQHLGHVKIGHHLSEASPSPSLTQTSCSSANDLLPCSGSHPKPSFIPYSPRCFFVFNLAAHSSIHCDETHSCLFLLLSLFHIPSFFLPYFKIYIFFR